MRCARATAAKKSAKSRRDGSAARLLAALEVCCALSGMLRFFVSLRVRIL